MVYQCQEKRYRIQVVANWSSLCLHPTTSFLTTECEANPKYMTIQCSPACMTCEQLDFDFRCPFDKEAPTVWGPGDLNAMFEQIVASPANEQYNVTILSSPKSYKDHEGRDGPWVITLDDFLSPAECDRLIQLGHDIGYKRSEDVGAKKFDGTYAPLVSEGRTSTTAWCLDDCFEDPFTVAVRERIEELTGIPDANSEYLQLLRYEEGQLYNVHHDYIDFHRDRAQGVRIVTVFLYLTDVEQGGGTNFPKLDLTAQPKQGRVLIWPSVLDSDPDRIDLRTDHQALPVEAGIKYSANGWIHARDFKTPFHTNCQ
jgi:prolyl 4-hydroxylase